jgi:hypothetical protein
MHPTGIVTRIAAAVVLSVACAAAISGATAARSQGPTVISGWKDGPVSMPPFGSPLLMASLQVPSGRWIAWAKLFVAYNEADGSSIVTCLLKSSGASGETNRGVVKVANPDWIPPSKQPLSLTTPGVFGRGGGSFRVECGSQGGLGGVTAHWIKIVAMRVGTLKRVHIGPRNQVTTTGSGSPTVVFGSRGQVDLPLDQPVTVGSISLAPGAWWIHASFSYEEGPEGYADCELRYGNIVRDSVHIEADHLNVVSVLEAAVTSSTTKVAKVICVGERYFALEGPDQPVTNFRITAVKLGTLIRDGRGGPSTYGSGWPRAKYKAVASVHATPGAWATLTQVPVEAGDWLFLAKAEVDANAPDSFAPADCQLRAEGDFDQTELGSWGDLSFPFAVVHRFPGSSTATLKCLPTESTWASQIRLIAFRLGSLLNVPM